MDTHENAPLTPRGREMMVRAVVDDGLSKAAAACQFHTTPKTVSKWIERFEAEGVEGLRDRSSRPHSSPSQATPAMCATVEVLRRQRHTGKQIAAEVGVSAATVSRILKRLGLNRLSALEPAEPVLRYERAAPGEIVHIDIKKLGKFNRIGHRVTGERAGQSKTRGIGWEYVHLAIDDHSRLAYSEILPDEKRGSCLALPVQRSALLSKPRREGRAHHDRQRLKLPIEPLWQSPAPAQNQASADQTLHAQDQRQGRGFVQTSLREWAYARAYDTSQQRAAELPVWFTALTGIAPMAASEPSRQSADSA